MAKTTTTIPGIPLNPEGMDDNTPLQTAPSFYQTRGVHSISERCLQRMQGKKLLKKFNTPILNIHADLKDNVFVETVDKLYLFTFGDESVVGDVTFVDTPSVHWRLI